MNACRADLTIDALRSPRSSTALHLRRPRHAPSMAIACAVATICLAQVNSTVGDVAVDNLGTVSGGYESWGFGISADGSVVVGTSAPDNTGQSRSPMRWDASTGMQSLGPHPGYTDGYARSTSFDGSVIAGNFGGSNSSVFRWTSDGGYQIIGSPSGGGASGGYMSDDGSTIVGWDGSGGFRWSTSSGYQHMTTPPGSSYNYARNISGDGTTVVGSAQYGSWWSAAVRWDSSGSPSILPGLPDSTTTNAYCVNLDGTIAAGVSFVNNGTGTIGLLVRWSDTGVVQNLGVLAGGRFSIPFDMSADGSVIVGYDQFKQTAFVWHESVGIVSLYDYLLDSGADLTGWTRFSNAQAVSADGSVITGAGLYNGEPRAFVVSGLSFSVIPGGGVAGLVSICACHLPQFRRRRRVG